MSQESRITLVWCWRLNSWRPDWWDALALGTHGAINANLSAKLAKNKNGLRRRENYTTVFGRLVPFDPSVTLIWSEMSPRWTTPFPWAFPGHDGCVYAAANDLDNERRSYRHSHLVLASDFLSSQAERLALFFTSLFLWPLTASCRPSSSWTDPWNPTGDTRSSWILLHWCQFLSLLRNSRGKPGKPGFNSKTGSFLQLLPTFLQKKENKIKGEAAVSL